jgi:hypothetical protein
VCALGRRRYNIVEANKLIKNVANFQYLGITLTNEKCLHQELGGDQIHLLPFGPKSFAFLFGI